MAQPFTLFTNAMMDGMNTQPLDQIVQQHLQAQQRPVPTTPLHFKFSLETSERVIYTDHSPAFLEHLFTKAWSGVDIRSQNGLRFTANVWHSLDDGAIIYLVERFAREITYNDSAPKYASCFEEDANTYSIKPSTGAEYLNVIGLQENIQQPFIGGLQPIVDKEMVYVWPVVDKIRTFKIPRPMNAYMLYRADKHAAIMAKMQEIHGPHPQNNSRVSIESGHAWRNESPSVRAYYAAMACEVKRQFEALYPQYRYQPRRSKDIHRRTRRTPVTM